MQHPLRPFQGMQAKWREDIEPAVGTVQRGVAVALYLALATTRCLELIGHDGPVIVEGPFTDNQTFLDALAILSRSTVLSSEGLTGTSQGTALLAGEGKHWQDNHIETKPKVNAIAKDMRAYAVEWVELVQQPGDDATRH